MGFFNPKEEVIEVQLTSYGKRLFSEGKFKPYYYSFVDNEIIYDNLYSAISESQNNIQSRIKEAPRLKTQTVFSGIETNIKKKKLIRNLDIKEDLQLIGDKLHSFIPTLGNSELSKEQIPAWSIKYLSGEISGSIFYITGSYQLLSIPRIESHIIYETRVENQENYKENEIGDFTRIYDDGTFIKVKEDSIIMEVMEQNSIFSSENFDIEVFKLVDFIDTKISSSWTELIPLYFTKASDGTIQSNTNLDTSFVEYFMDILVDEEIEDEEFCKLKQKRKLSSVFADRNLSCNIPEEKIGDVYKYLNEEEEECEK